MRKLVMIFCLVLILSLSFISATWLDDVFSKITGKITASEQCYDSGGEVLKGEYYCSSDVSVGETWIQNYFCSGGKKCVECNTNYKFENGNCVLAGSVPATIPIDGICGSSNGQVFSTKPTANLCSKGTASGIDEGTNTYVWSCQGSNGGVTKSCSATRTVSSTTVPEPDVSDSDVTCTDSDGGKNYSVKGTSSGTYAYESIVYDTRNNVEDYCVGESTVLREYYCREDGYLSIEQIDCDCENGACKEVAQEDNNENQDDESQPDLKNQENNSQQSQQNFYLPDRTWISCIKNSEEKIDASSSLSLLWWIVQRHSILENKCVEDNTLREYSCEGNSPVYIDDECANGCEDGKCVGEEELEQLKDFNTIHILLEDFNNQLDNSVTVYLDLKNVDYNFELSSFIFDIQFDASNYGNYFETNVKKVQVNLDDFDSPTKTLELFDDGLHNDGNANDKIYRNVWNLGKEDIGISSFLFTIVLSDKENDYYKFYKRIVWVEGLNIPGTYLTYNSGSEFALSFLSGNTKTPTNENLGANCEAVWYTGDSKENLDLVFVGDKYTDLDEFKQDINSIAAELLTESTWEAYKNRVNLWRVDELSNLDCEHTSDCNSGFLKLISADPSTSSTRMCCNAEDTRDFSNQCPNDYSIAVENSEIWGGTVYTNPENEITNKLYYSKFSPFTYVRLILSGNEDKFIGVAANTNTAGGRTTVHELGHLIANLPDYYNDDPNCEEHPCMMCSSHSYDFGNQDQCIDRARMVEQLNQFCKAKVSIIAKNPTSPYPNPYNPNSCNLKSDYYPGQCSQKVKYKVEYPDGGDPCYILTHVYNVDGQEVRALVSDEPQPAGEYIIEWDGTNNNRVPVASGTYFYVVSGGGDSRSQTLKATLIK